MFFSSVAMIGSFIAALGVLYGCLSTIVSLFGGRIILVQEGLYEAHYIYESLRRGMIYHSTTNYDIFNRHPMHRPSGFFISRVEGTLVIGQLSITQIDSRTPVSLNATMIVFSRNFSCFEATAKITRVFAIMQTNETQITEFHGKITPFPWQQKIVEQIEERLSYLAARKETSVVRLLLCGPPGIGKSRLALYAANKFGYALVVMPSRQIATINRYSGERTGTVALVNEVDSAFAESMLSPAERALPTSSYREKMTKEEWNNTLDLLEYASKMILIMTTNKSSAECMAMLHSETMDNRSMLRAQRVTIIDVTEDMTSTQIPWEIKR